MSAPSRGGLGDLDEARIGAHLGTSRFGRSIHLSVSTESTNDDARAAAAQGIADGHVVVADRQSKGRGAHGSTWESPGGTDLYLSIVARLSMPLAALPPLTLAVGLGVARAVDQAIDARAEIKWPNDILVDGLKCCGILVESVSLGQDVVSTIIGIGLDVNRERFSPELEGLATSLFVAKGSRLDRSLVLASVLTTVEEEVDRFVALGAGPIVAAVEARLAWRGTRVRVGDEEGVLLGLAKDGALRVATARGERPLRSGTLRRV